MRLIEINVHLLAHGVDKITRGIRPTNGYGCCGDKHRPCHTSCGSSRGIGGLWHEVLVSTVQLRKYEVDSI